MNEIKINGFDASRQLLEMAQDIPQQDTPMLYLIRQNTAALPQGYPRGRAEQVAAPLRSAS